MFFRSLFSIRFIFRIFEVYLYIGITSLCLYIITVFFFFQVGILYKLHNFQLCKRQISGALTVFHIENH